MFAIFMVLFTFLATGLLIMWPELMNKYRIGKIKIYEFDEGFAVQQFGHHVHNELEYDYDSSHYYSWYWFNTDTTVSYIPIFMTKEEAENVAAYLKAQYDSYLNSVAEEKRIEKEYNKQLKSKKIYKRM